MDNRPVILVVDDDKDFRDVVVTKLRGSGFSVVEAEDGASAYEKAKELKPDLILMDVKMPKLDGVAALMKMKDDPETKHIKVVLLTAFGDPRPEIFKVDNRFAKEVGAFEYILKTEDLDEVVRRVKSFVGTS